LLPTSSPFTTSPTPSNPPSLNVFKFHLKAIPYGNLNTNPNLSQSAPPDLEISALSSACSDSETKKLQNETESPPKEPNREQPNHDALRKGKNENLLHLLCYKVLKAKAKGENKFGRELKLNPTTTLSK